jgi:tetratricopeptide (TPR) repeat protein
MRTAALLLLFILVPLALWFSFHTLMFRADDWDEVSQARNIDFLLIGPLWGTIVFLWSKLLSPARRRTAIVAGLLAYLISASCLCGWTASVLRARMGPEVSTSDAEKNVKVVQAICNYRAENGMLPYSLDDLVPQFLDKVPDDHRLRWQLRWLFVGPKLLYSFDKDNGGWAPHLTLPKVMPTHAVPGGDALVQAHLAEYDRRIATSPTNIDHYTDKIVYLISINRRTEARATCKTAARAFPESWRPLMGLAMFAESKDLAQAEAQLRSFFEKHPAFIRYWCLSRYYRNLGRHRDAIDALRLAVKQPLENIEDEGVFVPNAYAFDAAKYAYEQHEYELVIDITKVWSSPRGTFSNPGADFYAFRAAAELALGRLDEAREHVKSARSALWANNLQGLARAVGAGDRSFIYDPGDDLVNTDNWKLFPSSEERQ